MQKYTLDPKDMETIYDGAVRAWISAPSITSPGERFTVRISILRTDGYLADDYEGELKVEKNSAIENLPEILVFSKENKGILLVNNCFIGQEGIFNFKITPRKGVFPVGQSHPIWVRKDFPYRLYWGDPHVHSTLGKCGTPYLPKSPDFGYWYARDVLGHEFCSITDHATALNAIEWKELRDLASRWNDPGSFVSILGFEGDYDGEDGGHFNIYFPTDRGEFKTFSSRYSEGSLDLIFEFARKHNALAVCHHSARIIRGRNFEISYFGGQDVEPVMEVYSGWGSSETYPSTCPIQNPLPHPKEVNYYRYALSHGFKLGAIGGSDCHATTAGGMIPNAKPERDGKQTTFINGGITGIYAAELTRESLFEAIRSRRCYASSAEKILLWTEAEGMPMGSEIEAKAAEISITASAVQQSLTEVLIIKNGEVAACFGDLGENKGFDADRKVFRHTWRDNNFSGESSYYVTARQSDGDMAWSSPIWIKPK